MSLLAIVFLLPPMQSARISDPGPAGEWQSHVTERTVDARGLKALAADVVEGHIRLVTERSGPATVRAVEEAKGGTEADRQWFFNRTRTSIEVRDGVLHVDKKMADESSRTLSNFSMRSEVEIHVPEGLAAELLVGAGGADVSGDYTRLKIRSGAGSVVLKDVSVPGDVELSTSAGSIEARGVMGDVSVRIQAGGVKLSGSARDVKVVAGGSVKLSGLRASGKVVDVRSSLGPVDATLAQLPSSRVRLTTGLGSVSLYVLSNDRFEPASGDSERSSFLGRKIRGRMSGTEVEVETGNGDAQVRSGTPRPTSE